MCGSADAGEPAQTTGDVVRPEIRSEWVAVGPTTSDLGAAADGVRAAVRRTDDALAVARRRVADHGRRATARARESAARAVEAARAHAVLEAAAIDRELRRAVLVAAAAPAAGAGRPPAGPAAVPVGTLHVRRHTEATAGVAVPMLVPVGDGAVRIVAPEDAMDAVLVLVTALVRAAGHAAEPTGRRLVVVNPRRRPLPPSLQDSTELEEVHDGRGLLRAVTALGGAPGRLVVLDHPHDLGLAGRRAVQEAAAGGSLRALLVHLDPEHAEVDVEHRRLRIPRCGVAYPEAACELWPARGGWRWSAHPTLRVTLPAQACVSQARASGHPRAPDGEGAPGSGAVDGSMTPAGALATYHALLERLAEVAREHDAAVATARAEERRALDRAAATRREALDAIAVEERAVRLLLRRVVGGRAPPDLPFVDEQPMRTVAPRVQPADPRDLTPLRAARAALAAAVESAKRTRKD